MKAGLVVVLALLFVGALLPVAAGQTAVSRAPTSLLLSMVPPQLPADGRSYPALVVSLLDTSGKPTLSLSDVLVYLSTTNATVASVPQNVTVPAGRAYVQVNVATSTKPGSVSIGATSQGLTSSVVQVSTVQPASGPASLAIFTSPHSAVQSLSGADGLFVVQLKNAAGQPALADKDTSLVITSTNTTMLPGTIDATIPTGSDLVYGNITPESWGTSTLTVLSPQLGTATAQLSILPSMESITISFTPPTVANGAYESVQVSVQVLGMPVQGAGIGTSASLGALSPPFGSTDSDGVFTAQYITAGQAPVTINATATSPVIGVLKASRVLIVTAASTSTTQAPSTTIPGLSTVVYYLPVIIAIVVIVTGYLLVRMTLRKRRVVQEDEYAVNEEKP